MVSVSAGVFDALKAHLEDIQWRGRALVVHIGDPPLGADPPYVFLWARALPAGSETVDNRADSVDESVNIQVVESTPFNVLALADSISEALEGFTPKVEGWRFGALRVHETSNVQTANAGSASATSRPPSWCTLTFKVTGCKETQERRV